MVIALTFILVIAGVVCFAVWIARRSEKQKKGAAPLPTLGLRVDPVEEYQDRFHEKAVHEYEHASIPFAQQHDPALKEPEKPTGGSESGAEDRQRRMDQLCAIREAHRPQLIGDLDVPIDTALSVLLPKEFIVLDLETTGLSPTLNEIIEIGAIRAALGSTTHTTFQTLVTPQREIGREITSLTGITQRMLDRDARPAEQVLGKFAEFIGDLPLVTFNAPFDLGFLWNAGKRHGISIRNKYSCALQLSRLAWPELTSHKLTHLAKCFGLPENDTHRSLGDTKRALYVFLKAVSVIGEPVRWNYFPLDWRVEAAYNKERDANRAFCAETRLLEASDLPLAIGRYTEAMKRMYKYEASVDGRYADATIIDRLTLCLWKSCRYHELIEEVDRFTADFPGVESSLLMTVRKRRERAISKLRVSGAP
jgi:DNA polymerase III epsilon subunit family exonuclease